MTQPTQTQPQTPPDNQTVQHVAEILAAGAIGALLIGALLKILRPFGVGNPRAIALALRVVNRGTETTPRMIGKEPPVRAQLTEETNYRAAYFIAAAQRIQASLDRYAHLPPEVAASKAKSDEEQYRLLHEAARRRRMLAAVEVAQSSRDYGETLGWWAHQDDKVTPECRAADGHNFSIHQKPLIGWPGQIHAGRCRCKPGPPFDSKLTVDQATARIPLEH